MEQNNEEYLDLTEEVKDTQDNGLMTMDLSITDFPMLDMPNPISDLNF
jgi:hypothetical protein|tara:strand:+ start:1760 stop:1903 length:144 start_codon:yes stop_codon:yes gene_type:complete